MIRVLVVDDSALVRKVLSEQLEKYDDVEVVGSTTSIDEAVEALDRLRPDIALVDLSTSGTRLRVRTAGSRSDDRATSVAVGGTMLAVAGRYVALWDPATTLPASPPAPASLSNVFVVGMRLD